VEIRHNITGTCCLSVSQSVSHSAGYKASHISAERSMQLLFWDKRTGWGVNHAVFALVLDSRNYSESSRRDRHARSLNRLISLFVIIGFLLAYRNLPLFLCEAHYALLVHANALITFTRSDQLLAKVKREGGIFSSWRTTGQYIKSAVIRLYSTRYHPGLRTMTEEGKCCLDKIFGV
jgi:hypothetical protein